MVAMAVSIASGHSSALRPAADLFLNQTAVAYTKQTTALVGRDTYHAAVAEMNPENDNMLLDFICVIW